MTPIDKDAFFWRTCRGELPLAPSSVLLGYEFIAWDEEDASIEIQFMGKPEFCNPIGDLQGGILAAMLDETLAPLVAATLTRDEFAPTLNLSISYLRPAKVGPLTGRGRFIRRGKKICFVEGQLLQNDRVVATATATSFVRRMPARAGDVAEPEGD